MESKKVVVFDMDGVLINSLPMAEDNLREQFPDITPEHIKSLHRGNYPARLKALPLYKVEITDEEKQKRKLAYSQRKLGVSMYPGIPELLEALSQNYALVINTSAPERNSKPILEHKGILKYFDFFACLELAQSKAIKFGLIAERFGVQAENMIFVTDAIGDINEAKEVNVPTIAVTWGIHTRTEFMEEEHENLIGIVDNVEELKTLIDARTHA